MKKYRHGKLVTGLTMGLVAVSLVGVGFSAWIVSEESKIQSEDITVNVADVKEQTITLENIGLTADNTITFDADKTDETAPIIWDKNGGEDMTFGITFTSTISNPKLFKGISIAAVEATALLSTWDAHPQNYIEAPFKVGVNASSIAQEGDYIGIVDSTWIDLVGEGSHIDKYITYDDGCETLKVAGNTSKDVNAHVKISRSGTVYTFIIEYTFKWGAHTEHINPSLYDTTPEKLDKAKEVMTAIKSQTPKFKLSLKHDPTTTVTVA